MEGLTTIEHVSGKDRERDREMHSPRDWCASEHDAMKLREGVIAQPIAIGEKGFPSGRLLTPGECNGGVRSADIQDSEIGTLSTRNASSEREATVDNSNRETLMILRGVIFDLTEKRDVYIKDMKIHCGSESRSRCVGKPQCKV